MRKLTRFSALTGAAIAVSFVLTWAAAAQTPPHTPGSICATEKFWCWASVFGRPGDTCVCPTTTGQVRGTYV